MECERNDGEASKERAGRKGGIMETFKERAGGAGEDVKEA